MRSAVVVPYDFAFPYNIPGIVFMFVDYIVFVHDIVLVFYNMFVPDDTLRTWASKNLLVYRFCGT